MSDHIECIVIGGGVIGIGVARRLAMAGRQVVVLESEAEIASHTSSRNSEVIHAGIYYPSGSLKAATCVAGREQLYAYCEARGVAYRRLGKLIVATEEVELAVLDRYEAAARANGVANLKRLNGREVTEMEPAVKAIGALHSPSTGIVDSHGLIQALAADLESAGGMVVCRSRVTRIEAGRGAFVLYLDDDAGFSISCDVVVNAAGLWAHEVAGRIAGFPSEHLPCIRYAKGHYFTLQGRSPFDRLVYPVATDGGLGVHVTLDLGGQAKFGPDVEWIDSVNYSFDESLKPQFEAAIRRYFPGLAADAIAPGYTGIRPKLSGPGEGAADFLIQGPADHGVSGLINLFGIESPGLTAVLPIADRVFTELEKQG